MAGFYLEMGEGANGGIWKKTRVDNGEQRQKTENRKSVPFRGSVSVRIGKNRFVSGRRRRGRSRA